MTETDQRLLEGAMGCMTLHLEAVNKNNAQAFRDTVFVPPPADGKPFQAKWNELRRMSPIQVKDIRVVMVGEPTENWGLKHTSVFLEVLADTALGPWKVGVVVRALEKGGFLVASSPYKPASDRPAGE